MGFTIKEVTGAQCILEQISKSYEIKREDILGSKNKQSEAKKDSIYLMKRMTGTTNNEIGELFGIGYTSVSKVYIRMEDEMRRNKRVKKRINQQISHFKP